MFFSSWNGPPSAPVITSVTSGTGALTVSWTAPPEKDVAAYRVWRSLDGSNYQILATVTAPETAYVDTGLSNGTYWYRVEAVDNYVHASLPSQPWYGVVGMSTAQLIASLQSQISLLQNQLAQANASTAAAITGARAQITFLEAQLANLQSSQATSNAATAAQLALLQANITKLQQQLNNLQSQQATQTISYANLAFEVIVVVLLIVLLLNQMRKPRAPQMMMAQPAQVPRPVMPPPPQAPPTRPEDEL